MITNDGFRCQTRFTAYFGVLACGVALLLSGCGGKAEVTSTPDTGSDPASSSETVSAMPAEQEAVQSAAPVSPARSERDMNEPPSVVTEPAAELPSESVAVSEAATVTPDSQDTPTDAAAKLEAQLATLQIPPVWLESVQPKWDTSKPWKEARLEIRRLLGEGDEASRREGIRLTWDYLQKDDIGDGHEYGMYLFLGAEPLWAVVAFREFLARTDNSYPPYFAVMSLAALYTDYGLFEEAEKVLDQGATFKSPDPKWDEVRAAELHDAYGDLYAAWGKIDEAQTNYQEAVRLYPLGKPPYGGFLLPRKAKKVQAKIDLLSKSSLDDTELRDGRYKETTLGYSGDIELAVEIKGGRMASVRVVKHEEKIDQNACVIIPQRITEQHSLQVDGISGATVTKAAIVTGTLSALKKAGLK